MTKYITVKLTEDQVRYLYNLINTNTHVQPYEGEEFQVRLLQKLKAELVKLKITK